MNRLETRRLVGEVDLRRKIARARRGCILWNRVRSLPSTVDAPSPLALRPRPEWMRRSAGIAPDRYEADAAG